MKIHTVLLPLLASFCFLFPQSLAAQDASKQQASKQDKSTDSDKAVAVPPELERFSGMMIGKLASRDVERGSFTVKIDYVARVWENNKALTPRAAVGKTLKVTGVTGEWLDQLILIRPGDSIEFEAQHREGESLRFPGEWLKKVPAFDPNEHPVPPKGFRGFSGVVTAKVVDKRLESRELVLNVQRVDQTDSNSRAPKPESVVGKKILLAGFWAGMSKPFDPLKKGDTIRVGVFHRVPQSDHMNVRKFAEKVKASDKSPSPNRSNREESSQAIPAGVQGFRGIIRGTLVSRDVEKGTLQIKAQKATRVWKESRAKDLDDLQDKTFLVKGISGKWVDVLLTLKPGDLIDVEAFHNGAEHLDFIKEYLQKVE